MRTYSITEARKQLGELVNRVKYQRAVIAVGQHGDPDVLLVPNDSIEEEYSLTAMAAASGSLAFLADEPDIYPSETSRATIEFGSIVLVPFPFTDLSSSKVRPALVVSSSSRSSDLILCFITSRLDSRDAHQLLLEPIKQNGLKVASAVRFNKIATLERSVILGSIGSLDAAFLRRHQKKFHSVFGF